jgi:flagellar motor switch/type III secretory pathway protein FliN
MSDEMMVENETGWGLLAQIPLRLSVEIGSVSRSMQDLLDLKQGTVVGERNRHRARRSGECRRPLRRAHHRSG